MNIETVSKLVFDGSTIFSDSPFESSDFINKLFPNGFWDLLIQLIAFVALLVIVFFIGYKPVKKMVAKRRSYIAEQIRSAEEANKTAQQAAATKEATIQEGKEEASRIIAEARAQAENDRAKILAEGEASLALKKKAADEEIHLAKEKSKADVKNEIVDVALLASSKVLGREVNEEDNRRLVNRFVEGLEEKE